MTCSLFRKLMMDFIDDELPEEVRPGFYAHASVCPACQKELKELRFVKQALAGLPPIAVTPEFDFRLKASLSREASRLRSPMYRLNLYLRDNVYPVVGVPAAAMLLIAGTLMYNGSREFPATRIVNLKPAVEAVVPVPAATDSSDVDVHYVLESVDLSQAGAGVPSNRASDRKRSGTNTVNLIRY